MKFKDFDELIEFEENLSWIKANPEKNYRLVGGLKAKFDQLRGDKYLGVYDGKIVSVVSDQFKPISVLEVALACEQEFGNEFEEKSYRQGIVRVYDSGIEDEIGKVSPLVVFPANNGNMAVKLGVYHKAFVCSNGLIVSNGYIGERIIHRLSHNDLSNRIRRVSENLRLVLDGVSNAQEMKLTKGEQLAMIVLGLNKTDSLVSKALSKYYPEGDTLWDTIQAITYVATHETKKGYDYSNKAGELLIDQELRPYELVDAASYVFGKEFKGQLSFEQAPELYSLARGVLA